MTTGTLTSSNSAVRISEIKLIMPGVYFVTASVNFKCNATGAFNRFQMGINNDLNTVFYASQSYPSATFVIFNTYYLNTSGVAVITAPSSTLALNIVYTIAAGSSLVIETTSSAFLFVCPREILAIFAPDT